MKIQVTQECIDKGVRGEPAGCPIALALMWAGFPYPRVGARMISTGVNLLHQNNKIYEFRRNFDLGRGVSPFEFETDELTKEY